MMNYLLFNHDILISDGSNTQRIGKDLKLSNTFDQVSEAHVCTVDCDVLIASAPENILEKKDGILAKKFSEFYQGDYVLQDERIDHNLFQVIGIKSEKVKEVYSLMQGKKVRTFVPYALAIRNFLAQQKMIANDTIVFLDDLGNEQLITVFEGLRFSRTRSILNHAASQVLPELKRSVINFQKKLVEQKDKVNERISIITNNKALGLEIKEIERNLNVEFVESSIPAIEGLKIGGFEIKYILPEEIIKKRKKQVAYQRAKMLIISTLSLCAGVIFFIFNQGNLKSSEKSFGQEKLRNSFLEEKINKLDPMIYHNALKAQKQVNYALVMMSISKAIPMSYQRESFSFIEHGNHWILEEYLDVSGDFLLEDIPARGILKNAEIKSLLVNNKPGKLLRVQL